MALSFIGSAEASAANGADVTITLPSTLQGDLVIVSGAIGDNDGVNFTMAMTTGGYTLVPGADLFADDTQDTNLGVFYKFMGGTPDTSAVFTGQGGVDAACAAVAMVFRGVDATTPFDVASTVATGIDTMHPNPPSIDHLNPSGLWTVIAGASGHTLAGAGTYTFPTGYTTNALDVGADDTSDVTVGMGYKTTPTDPEDPGVMTHSGTDNAAFSWAAVTMALRPQGTVSYTLVCDVGTYTYTGQAAALTRTYSIVCDEGSYSYTGQDATLTYTPGASPIAYTLTCDVGVYNYTGQDATLAYSAAVEERANRGDGMPGWERFKDLKPRKHIPKQVEEVIIDLLVKQVKAPITTLKTELKALEIKYDPAYGDFLKKLLKEEIEKEEVKTKATRQAREKAIRQAREDEDMLVLMYLL